MMAGLSPDASVQTNNLLLLLLPGNNTTTLTQDDIYPAFAPRSDLVRQNCALIASLYTSLIAAGFTALAKQWLAYYERTAPARSLQAQALNRAEKYRGLEKWNLQYVVEASGTLILISLALFVIAMSSYLWSINSAVAALVTVFSSIILYSYAVMIIAGTFFPASPFQTSLSIGLRHVNIATRIQHIHLSTTNCQATRRSPQALWCQRHLDTEG
jgi:CHASE2 domain-containing sensor protein